MLGGGAGKHRADQLRIEFSEKFHGFHGDFAQVAQDFRLLVRLIQRLIFAQRRFDFLIVRQLTSVRRTGLACGFALGGGVILDAVFGHQARGEIGQVTTHVAMFGHG